MGYTTYKLEPAEFNHGQPIEKTVELASSFCGAAAIPRTSH